MVTEVFCTTVQQLQRLNAKIISSLIIKENSEKTNYFMQKIFKKIPLL